MTGVGNNEMFALGSEFGVGMEYTVGAGVVVATGSTMIEYNGNFAMVRLIPRVRVTSTTCARLTGTFAFLPLSYRLQMGSCILWAQVPLSPLGHPHLSSWP